MRQKQAIMQRLEQAGAAGVTSSEFLADVEIGHRFGARIQELRDQGHTITAQRLAGGTVRYRLRATHDVGRAPGETDPRAGENPG